MVNLSWNTISGAIFHFIALFFQRLELWSELELIRDDNELSIIDLSTSEAESHVYELNPQIHFSKKVIGIRN